MLGSPVASVFVGFGNVGEKFGAISSRGARKLALSGSFSFCAVLTSSFGVSYSVRLCPTMFCLFFGRRRPVDLRETFFLASRDFCGVSNLLIRSATTNCSGFYISARGEF